MFIILSRNKVTVPVRQVRQIPSAQCFAVCLQVHLASLQETKLVALPVPAKPSCPSCQRLRVVVQGLANRRRFGVRWFNSTAEGGSNQSPPFPGRARRFIILGQLQSPLNVTHQKCALD